MRRDERGRRGEEERIGIERERKEKPARRMMNVGRKMGRAYEEEKKRRGKEEEHKGRTTNDKRGESIGEERRGDERREGWRGED